MPYKNTSQTSHLGHKTDSCVDSILFTTEDNALGLINGKIAKRSNVQVSQMPI